MQRREAANTTDAWASSRQSPARGSLLSSSWTTASASPSPSRRSISSCARAPQPGGAHRRLTATLGGLVALPELNGCKVRLLGWVGSHWRWRVQLDQSALAPLSVSPASLLALGWEWE
mmetsp:Transcript_42257/g.104110  ORF Transcript_42257/g.104110 Transcript_42257/m.104110 type:complete len:118 (+) Transcript_42257:196-549(+)